MEARDSRRFDLKNNKFNILNNDKGKEAAFEFSIGKESTQVSVDPKKVWMSKKQTRRESQVASPKIVKNIATPNGPKPFSATISQEMSGSAGTTQGTVAKGDGTSSSHVIKQTGAQGFPKTQTYVHAHAIKTAMPIEVVGPNHIKLLEEEGKPPDPDVGNATHQRLDAMQEDDSAAVAEDIMVEEMSPT